MAQDPVQNREMISLSSDLCLFDELNLTLEALEQRLEMAFISVDETVNCGTFACGVFQSQGQ